VLSAADSACYVAKELGRNRIHLYSPDDEQLVQHQEEMHWVSRIASAFEQNRFLLVFQPIKALNDPDHGYHFEILMRMHDEEGKIVKPDDFLPAAERFTLMPTLDRWVVRQTFQWLNQNPKIIEGLNTCGVNLSGNSLGDEYFLDFLLSQFKKLNIPKHKICFEITETAAILNLENALFLIEHLRAEGCQFALDDFGAGLSSYAYLKKIPVDYLKIDGAFVKDVIDDPIDDAMVRSIHEIGHILGKKTVAEYVENDVIEARVKAIGVDFIQGYAVSKYLPLDQFADFYQIP
ncbi:MAG: EAL domain-containing protein, partial [Methylococcales bacterium]|nr:EAL domain-containing protein [Methylococcales bacterium]